MALPNDTKSSKLNGHLKRDKNLFRRWFSTEVAPNTRCNAFCKDGKLIESLPYGAIETIWDMFKYDFINKSLNNCLGWRVDKEYHWMSYDAVERRALKVGIALVQLAKLQRQQVIGIFAPSQPAWVITALGAMTRSLVIVPLYETLGYDSCSFIIAQTEMSIVFVDNQVPAKKLLEEASKQPTTLRFIVLFNGELTINDLAQAKSLGIALMTLDQFISGINPPYVTAALEAAQADDLVMIQYTSGTTGKPKGVMLTHRNFVSNAAGTDLLFSSNFDKQIKFTNDEVCLLYLPLAHVYAFGVTIFFLLKGASIGFYSGNVAQLVEDAAALKPTFLPLVPRVMTRVYAKVLDKVNSSGKMRSKLFWFAYKQKKKLMFEKGQISRTSIWDLIAFKRVQNLIGGRVAFMTTGSAPIAPEVIEFWRVVFGAFLLEGYGQTECSAVATMAIGPGGGNVGHPSLCCLVKLVDAPQCNYFVKDGKGEICVQGSNVMKGYFKEDILTSEAIDAEGWLHTGDVGEFLPDGSLHVIDRVKHVFKLAQGEYIAPEKIEQIYAMCPLIAQVFVDGSSLESFAIAIVVPEAAVVAEWASKNSVDASTALNNPSFIRHILDAMVAVGKAHKLNSLEQVKSIHIVSPDQPFSIANGLLTPTMKNKRSELRHHFKEEIAALYKVGPMAGGSTLPSDK